MYYKIHNKCLELKQSYTRSETLAYYELEGVYNYHKSLLKSYTKSFYLEKCNVMVLGRDECIKSRRKGILRM